MSYHRGDGILETEDGETNRRTRWAALGIATDELSGPALALGLVPESNTPLASLLRHQSELGEPVLVPLRMLLRNSLGEDRAFADRDIYVCENPTLVSMAAGSPGTKLPSVRVHPGNAECRHADAPSAARRGGRAIALPR
jgi:hypothetical protein